MPRRPARPRLSPRKTPLQGRSAATVATILEAAARVLERHGLEGFNTNAVAERAGVSIGSLYQYFPSKDAVMAALIRADAANLLAAMEAAAAGPATSLEETVAALVAVGVAHQADRPALARLLDVEQARLPLDRETAATLESMGALLASALERHRALLPGLNLAEAAQDLPAIVRGIVDTEALVGAAIDAEALQRRAMRAVMGYLRGG